MVLMSWSQMMWKGLVWSVFTLILLVRAGFKDERTFLTAARSLFFFVLVVLGKLGLAKSLGGLDSVARMTLDDVCYQGMVLRVGQECDGVHSTVSKMVPHSVLKVDKAA